MFVKHLNSNNFKRQHKYFKSKINYYKKRLLLLNYQKNLEFFKKIM